MTPHIGDGMLAIIAAIMFCGILLLLEALLFTVDRKDDDE